MSEANNFLPFLINEDIYVIDTQAEVKSVENLVIQPESEEEKVTPKADSIKLDSPKVEQAVPTKRTNEILVIFDNPISKSLPAADLEYLGKILGAIGRSIDKTDFQNVAATTPNAAGYAYVIAFTPNHQLPVPASTQLYISTPLGDGLLIVADALSNIAGSTDLRKKLWEVLQQVFR